MRNWKRTPANDNWLLIGDLQPTTNSERISCWTEVQNSMLVLRMNISAKNPARTQSREQS